MQITQTLATQTGADVGVSVTHGVPRVGRWDSAYGLTTASRRRRLDATGHRQVRANGDDPRRYLRRSVRRPTRARPHREAASNRLPCTGDCSNTIGNTASPQTGALDLGAQYLVTDDSIFTVGAAVWNVGFKLQVNDTPGGRAPRPVVSWLRRRAGSSRSCRRRRVRAAADLCLWRLSDAGTRGSTSAVRYRSWNGISCGSGATSQMARRDRGSRSARGSRRGSCTSTSRAC